MSSARTDATARAAAGPGPGVTPAPGARRWQAAAARWLPIVIPAATVLALGLWGLPRHNAMGNDEIVTRYAATLGLGQLARMVFLHTDIFHALYYLFMHVWVTLGTSPTIIRIPSLIAAVAAVALTAHVGRRLSGSAWTGLFAGMIMALTPSTSFYAQTARSYTMVTLVVLGSTLALVRALEAEGQSPQPGAAPAGPRTPGPRTSLARCARDRVARRWLAYCLLIALGGYLNEISLAVLAGHAVTVLLARPGRRALVHGAVAGAAGAALVLPVVLISFLQRSSASWITRPRLHDIGMLVHDCFGATNLVALFLLACAVLAILPAGGSAWWRSGGISLPSVAAPLLVVPAGLVFTESLVGKALYVDRYVLFAEAGAALLAGSGVARIGRWLGERTGRPAVALTSLVTGAVICAGLLGLQLGPQHRARTPLTRQFDYGDPAFYIGARAKPGDGVLFFNSFYRKIRLGYPDDFRDITDFAMSESPVRSGTLNGFDKPFSAVGPLMLSYQRIWVVGRPPSARVSSPVIRAEGGLLMRRFTLAAERKFRGMVVTLWLRR